MLYFNRVSVGDRRTSYETVKTGQTDILAYRDWANRLYSTFIVCDLHIDGGEAGAVHT